MVDGCSMVGFGQLILIFAIVLVLFGAGKIPKIMKDFGVGIRAFKDGLEGVENELNFKSQSRQKKTNRKIKEAKKVENN